MRRALASPALDQERQIIQRLGYRGGRKGTDRASRLLKRISEIEIGTMRFGRPAPHRNKISSTLQAFLFLRQHFLSHLLRQRWREPALGDQRWDDRRGNDDGNQDGKLRRTDVASLQAVEC